MYKTIAVVVLLSGNALALDCGVYYTYGTVDYARCQEQNSNESSQRAQAQLDRFTGQVNNTVYQDSQQAQQADANVQLQNLIRVLQNQQNNR